MSGGRGNLSRGKFLPLCMLCSQFLESLPSYQAYHIVGVDLNISSVMVSFVLLVEIYTARLVPR